MMKIAILGPSEIAFRRFVPALTDDDSFEYAGVCVATAEERTVGEPKAADADLSERVTRQREKAQRFLDSYGGSVFNSFEEALQDESIDAVYIPLPPALHFAWAMKALESGKHVLVEKPCCSAYEDAKNLMAFAQERNLAVHENYMFAYHSQIDELMKAMKQDELGDIRLIRIDFGFPFRGSADFRYSKDLGGGALLDAGGYTLKLASLLLGPSSRVTESQLNYGRDLEVDLYGSATVKNDDGDVAQVAFGMDNDYRCLIDVWGSKASLSNRRILTAPSGFTPTFTLSSNGNETAWTTDPDDSFKNSIRQFKKCIDDEQARRENYEAILRQAKLVDDCISGSC